MWDFIENGLTPTYTDAHEIEGTDPGKATYVKKPKTPRDYTTKQRREVGLDGYVKCVIFSNVKGIYLAQIRHINSPKEMWDTVKSLSEVSEEIKESKLSIACNKFDDFTMLHSETIEMIKKSFHWNSSRDRCY